MINWWGEHGNISPIWPNFPTFVVRTFATFAVPIDKSPGQSPGCRWSRPQNHLLWWYHHLSVGAGDLERIASLSQDVKSSNWSSKRRNNIIWKCLIQSLYKSLQTLQEWNPRNSIPRGLGWFCLGWFCETCSALGAGFVHQKGSLELSGWAWCSMYQSFGHQKSWPLVEEIQIWD